MDWDELLKHEMATNSDNGDPPIHQTPLSSPVLLTFSCYCSREKEKLQYITHEFQQTCTIYCTCTGGECGRAERRLINDLMMFYQKLERPVVNESDAIQLKFGLTLQQIMNVVG